MQRSRWGRHGGHVLLPACRPDTAVATRPCNERLPLHSNSKRLQCLIPKARMATGSARSQRWLG
jgi:hypothetical protein